MLVPGGMRWPAGVLGALPQSAHLRRGSPWPAPRLWSQPGRGGTDGGLALCIQYSV